MHPHWMSIVLFTYSLTGLHSEWVEIPQMDSVVGNKRDLLIDHSDILSGIYSKKDLNNLKYEDLIDIVGPDYEKHFLKYLKDHKSEVNESNTSLVLNGSLFENTTTDLPVKFVNQSVFSTDLSPKLNIGDNGFLKSTISSEKLKSFEDAKYRNTTIDLQTSNLFHAADRTADSIERKVTTSSGKGVNGKIMDTKEFNKDADLKNTNTNTTDKKEKPKLILKVMKMKTTPSTPLSFSGIFKFLKNIQNSFVVDASGGLRGKIKSLEKFRDQLLINIGKNRLVLLSMIKAMMPGPDIKYTTNSSLKLNAHTTVTLIPLFSGCVKAVKATLIRALFWSVN